MLAIKFYSFFKYINIFLTYFSNLFFKKNVYIYILNDVYSQNNFLILIQKMLTKTIFGKLMPHLKEKVDKVSGF